MAAVLEKLGYETNECSTVFEILLTPQENPVGSFRSGVFRTLAFYNKSGYPYEGYEDALEKAVKSALNKDGLELGYLDDSARDLLILVDNVTPENMNRAMKWYQMFQSEEFREGLKELAKTRYKIAMEKVIRELENFIKDKTIE